MCLCVYVSVFVSSIIGHKVQGGLHCKLVDMNAQDFDKNEAVLVLTCINANTLRFINYLHPSFHLLTRTKKHPLMMSKLLNPRLI